MALEWLVERLRSDTRRPLLIGRGASFSAGDCLSRAAEFARDSTIGPVALLVGDYSPTFLSALIGLLSSGRIVALASPAAAPQVDWLCAAARIQSVLSITDRDTLERSAPAACAPPHPLQQELIDARAAGLIIFSSGTTGAPKAVLHSADRFTQKYREATPRPARTIALPPPDHMAGLDTLFYALSGGGVLIAPDARTPDAVCRAIQDHRAELLPCTPSFLNLLLASVQAGSHDLSSLRVVTYGSEVMPARTLERARELLPRCRFIQKYGTTELGSPRTRSKSDQSIWFTVDDPHVEFQVRNGTLWLRAPASMLGYLNAEFTPAPDGWYDTGDVVETDRDFIRIVGRKTDRINVGGNKVSPQEVEDVIRQMDGVVDAHVSGEPNALMGQVVRARVQVLPSVDVEGFPQRLRAHCRAHLASFMVPVRIECSTASLAGDRLKKARPAAG